MGDYVLAGYCLAVCYSPVFVWYKSPIVVMSPWSVCLYSIVSVGVNVWVICPTVVLAFIVNVGVISRE